ncbi:C40 family peptidase [Defluviitalea phaphyphila]|uniref:C40 family peptidase n=1 Tax=Defluviitalea phaphyphila TaxID=1473580 RepID=UPI000730FC75|nr:C40 family peptidase [Defluviitalea phaphyphila]
MMKWHKLVSCIFVAGLFFFLSVTNSYAKTIGMSIENNVDVWEETTNTEKIITTLNKEDKVEILGIEKDCYIVKLDDGNKGYILKDLLNILSTDGISTGDRVNIRQAPNTSSEILGQVNKGDSLIIIGKSGEWYNIEYNNQEAWIHSNYVNLIEGDIFQLYDNKISSNNLEDNNLEEEIVKYAKQFIGTPYRYGGTDLYSGVDCSGFTQTVMGNFGINLNRVSRYQAEDGIEISKNELKKGDLIFFDTSGSNNGQISHVGIYIGNNQFIHAESSRGVCIDSLNQDYYINTYVKAIRVI